ncbi:MAG: hypothetical protein KBH11_08195 [Bacteroidia bacterium]|nr:hypothetical protein [Bacteroidia bacterium]
MKFIAAKLILTFVLIFSFVSVLGQDQDSTIRRSLLLRVPYKNRLDSIFFKDSITYLIPHSLFRINKKFLEQEGYTTQKVGFLGQRLNDYYANSLKAKRNLKYFRIARVVGAVETLVLFPLFIGLESNNNHKYNTMYHAPSSELYEPKYLHYGMWCLISGPVIYHFVAGHFFKKSIRAYKKSTITIN